MDNQKQSTAAGLMLSGVNAGTAFVFSLQARIQIP